jgi:hypothetical protein
MTIYLKQFVSVRNVDNDSQAAQEIVDRISYLQLERTQTAPNMLLMTVLYV